MKIKDAAHPRPSSNAVSRAMPGNRRSDTPLGIFLRSELNRYAARFRLHHQITILGLTVQTNLALSRKQLAVFVDGRFCHCCPKHGNRSLEISTYWFQKHSRNRACDYRFKCALKTNRRSVISIWKDIPIPKSVSQAVTLRRMKEGTNER